MHGRQKQKLHINNFYNEWDALGISADDRLRSQYMQRIINEGIHGVSIRDNFMIPHLLVQFWDEVKIPSDVQKCIDSWKPLERRGFERFLFDDERARQFIKENYDSRYLDAFKQCRHPAMRSDYFRLCFIMVNGGFYIDADDTYKDVDFDSCFHDNKLKLQPLCYNPLTDSMIDIADALSTPYNLQDLTFYVNNNPIVAPPNHPIIHRALERATEMLIAQTKNDKQDVQSTTGPGNLTICLVQHSIETASVKDARDFTFLTHWNNIAESKWPLNYRQDKRNWRLWDGYDPN